MIQIADLDVCQSEIENPKSLMGMIDWPNNTLAFTRPPWSGSKISQTSEGGLQ
jgi:hypothetical protein